MSEVDPSIIEKAKSGDLIILDTRIPHLFSRRHIPFSVNAPYGSYGWARSIKEWLDGNTPEIVLVCENQAICDQAVRDLHAVGISVGSVISDNLQEWASRDYPVSAVEELSPAELFNNFNEWTVIDVRDPYEWQSGTVQGSLKIPMNELQERVGELSNDRKYAIICAHGNRSQYAATYLADLGFRAATVVGGMYRWIMESFPLDDSTQ
ncbi:MAG: rhodanese-like domain-containing protein [Thermoplasmataceae archaeon]